MFLRARQDAAIDFEPTKRSLKLNAALVYLTRMTPLLDAGVLKQFSRYKSQIECRKRIGGTRHLKRFSATWRMAFNTFRFERLTLSSCTGRQRSLGVNRICVTSMFEIALQTPDERHLSMCINMT